MKRITLVLTFAFWSLIAVGQTYDFTRITVNGLELYESYTQTQIVELFGTPTFTLEPEITDPYPELFEYRFNNNCFSFSEGVFIAFNLRTNTYLLNDFVRVGDPISKVAQMGGSLTEGECGVRYWQPATSADDYADVYVMFHYNSANTITGIVLVAPL